MKKLFKSKLLIQVVVASMVATLATAIIVSAATTIGNNIDTGGNLTVSGNIGIGTTTPSTSLSIGDTGDNTINISATATSTFGLGIDLRAGCFAVNGVCVGGGASGGSGTVNSGLAGQLPYYLADGTAVSATSTLFITPAGNVGVSTTSPDAKLSIDGTAVVSDNELVTNGTFTGSADGWTLGSDEVYGDNNVISTYDSAWPYLFTTFETVAGNTYLLTFTISSASSPAQIYFDNNSLSYNNGPFSDGTHTVAFQTDFTGTETISFYSSNSVAGDTWTLDNVSIKEMSLVPALKVIGYDGTTWLSLGGDILGNTALGDNSLSANTTGKYNSAIGSYALYSNTTGYQNSAMGYNALSSNTTGGNNSAMGYGALSSNTDGASNSAVGMYALKNNTSGSENSAMGLYALKDNTTGYDNSAMGYQTLVSNTTGYENSAMGYYALLSNTTGNLNSAVGSRTLQYNTSGLSNSAMGYAALRDNTTGNYNSVMGSNALLQNTTGNNNIALGYQAGFSNTTGSNNIALGYQAGSSNTTGLNNIIIGYNTNLPAIDSSNMLSIGNLIYATGLTTLASLSSDVSAGYVGIGTSTPANTFEVHASTGTTTASFISQTASVGSKLILEDMDGAGCSEITVLDGVISARTVDCPAN